MDAENQDPATGNSYLLLAAVHSRAAAAEPADGELYRLWAKQLLRTLADLRRVHRPADPDGRYYQATIWESIDCQLADISPCPSVLHGLDCILDRIVRGAATMVDYAQWCATASSTLGCVLYSTEPDNLIPSVGIYNAATRVRALITQALEPIAVSLGPWDKAFTIPAGDGALGCGARDGYPGKPARS
ncbi:hypothetical protein ACIQMR_37685 [Streptomyces sp. NPDC091376]|uniref:hypothetical protein n=1 Tax=Streptomyces sp. NPDC091376 TaxID=3365994 RepID=UPI0037FE908E